MRFSLAKLSTFEQALQLRRKRQGSRSSCNAVAGGPAAVGQRSIRGSSVGKGKDRNMLAEIRRESTSSEEAALPEPRECMIDNQVPLPLVSSLSSGVPALSATASRSVNLVG